MRLGLNVFMRALLAVMYVDIVGVISDPTNSSRIWGSALIAFNGDK